MTWLFLACNDAPVDAENERRAVDYAGKPGTRLAYAPGATPDDVPLWLAIEDGAWELREGTAWDEATMLSRHEVTVEGPLLVDGVEFLPAEPRSSSDYTAYYGTFPDTVSTEVPEGELAGPWVFARDLGPVHLTVAGVERDLVYYEYVDEDTGD